VKREENVGGESRGFCRRVDGVVPDEEIRANREKFSMSSPSERVKSKRPPACNNINMPYGDKSGQHDDLGPGAPEGELWVAASCRKGKSRKQKEEGDDSGWRREGIFFPKRRENGRGYASVTKTLGH